MFYVNKFQTLCSLARVGVRTAFFYFHSLFRNKQIRAGKLKVVQNTRFRGRGQLVIGDNCQLGVISSINFKHGEIYLSAVSENAAIEIGGNVVINNNAQIIASKARIFIGDDTIIGPNFVCYDSDFHSIQPERRRDNSYSSKDVIIGKNVFIGANVTILKGAVIGDNSVIAAGCIVNGKVDSNTIMKCALITECVPIKS